MDKTTVLMKYFGHTSFRYGQEMLIDAILAGRDVFGVMPTGGGKSLCYQVPAIMQEGMALIISPLISLMKDQVMSLKNVNINAAYINSSLTPEQLNAAYRNMRAGKYKIVYVAPERLDADSFTGLIQNTKISLIAVDEAHCISQWGQNFRPSYLKIVEFLEKLPQRPVISAFTATATQQVRDDIIRLLKLRNPYCLTTGFDRPNLYFDVLKPKNKQKSLRVLINQRQGKSGIVYCATRKLVDSVCADLCAIGIPATRYHAGLSDDERRINQDDFIYDRRPVIVATNAFGMGIDKSNVSYVIHYNMPKSLEAYYQEAGRAGRDGEKADCILLYSPADTKTAQYLIENSGDNEELSEKEQLHVREQDERRLHRMVSYCKTVRCLRGYILDYFGQSYAENCGNCGNCLGEYVTQDITNEAKMILSCVKRVKDKLGYSVGVTLIVKILRGAQDKRVIHLKLDELTTYGLMKTYTEQQVKEYVEQLEAAGYLRTNPSHGGIELTAASKGVLFKDEQVPVSVKKEHIIEKHTAESGYTSSGRESDLFIALKSLRYKLAQQERVPAYIIFSNACLADMARKVPKTMDEFLNVSGVGEIKAARYGKEFINAIVEHDL